MRLWKLKFQISNLLFLVVAASASAGTVTGVVRNGTTGSVVSRQDVVLIELQGGMETVASTKTDGQGRYTLEHPSVGQGPVLIRVNYRGVNFHQSVPPGRGVADVEVFEPTTEPAAAEIVSRAIIFQPNGPSLLVGEEYAVHNHAKPPRAYFKNDSTFEFAVPEGAQLGPHADYIPNSALTKDYRLCLHFGWSMSALLTPGTISWASVPSTLMIQRLERRRSLLMSMKLRT